jgi:hypothetical protein
MLAALMMLAVMPGWAAASTELIHTLAGGHNSSVSQEPNTVIVHSIDNGFVMTGYSDAFSNGTGTDILVVKTDTLGVVMWTKTYGGSQYDSSGSMIEHSIDNGLVIAGNTGSFGVGNWDIMLFKTDSVGVEQWTKTYGGSGYDYAFSVIEHSNDTGLVIAGFSPELTRDNDFILMKTDSEGVLQWARTYGGTGNDYADTVIEHSIDTGLVMFGTSRSYGAGASDFMLVKTDSSGVEMWTKTYGFGNAETSYWIDQSLIEHSIDSGLVMVGATYSIGAGRADILLVKTNSVGVEVWAYAYGGGNYDEATSLFEHSVDNGLVMTGWTEAYSGPYAALVVKTDSAGVLEWSKWYGGSGSDWFYFGVEHPIDSGLVMVGYSESFGESVNDAEYLLVIQPGNGLGNIGNDIGNLTTTVNATEGTDVTLAKTNVITSWTGLSQSTVEATHTANTRIVYANPSASASTSPSPSQSSSQTKSSSQTVSTAKTKKKRRKRDGRVSFLIIHRRISTAPFEAALKADSVDKLEEQSDSMQITRSLLQTSAKEVDARLEFDVTYSASYSNTTVNVLVLYSSAKNATFTVAEGIAAIENAARDPNSRVRKEQWILADSLQSVSGGSVSASDLTLCADGVRRESCPDDDDDDEDLIIGLGVAAGVCVLLVIFVLVLRQKNGGEGANTPEEDPVELDAVTSA